MVLFLLFFFELFILFLLSRTLSRSLSSLLFLLTGSERWTIQILAVLLFPGTVVHELAHAISAGILGVTVGHIEFVPKLHGDKVKLGSVQIAKTDFFRRFLIGAAPFFTGTALVLGILYFAARYQLFDTWWILIVIGYVVFEIGNTMFSSRKDMEGALEFFGTILLLIIIGYFLGVRLPAFNPDSFFAVPLIQTILQKGCLFLLIPICLDIAIIALLKIFKS